FGPMNLAERMNKAEKAAGDVLDNQAYSNRALAREHERPIDSSLMKWARANMNQYVSWLTNTHQQALLDNITKLEELQVDMVTIKE
ncbi:hypothetical protein LAJ55_14445, partial [Streptococcus pneumoniae]|uniref:hypothetical protein n=1 Tax=Streptococcus pneumoniae TaxID=1313 RepID=UPI001CBDB8D1